MSDKDNQKTTETQNTELSPSTVWSVQGSNLRPPVYKGIRTLGITPITEGGTGQKSPQKTRQSAESPISNDNEKTTVDFVVPDARERVPAHLQFVAWGWFA